MYKWVSIIASVLFFMGVSTVSAENGDDTKPSVLLVHSLENQGQMKEVRMLDALLGQFTDDITLTTDDKLQEKEVNSYSHLFYYGGVPKQLSKSTISVLNNYQGKIYAAGHNVDQFSQRFSFLEWEGETLINSDVTLAGAESMTLPEERIVYDIRKGDKATVAAKSEDVPLVVHSGGDYYFSGETFSPPFGQVITESLAAFFEKDNKSLVKYLRLEDVDPLSDPNQLQSQAEYLAEMNVPYMVSLIPVHTNEEGETVHLSDSPELIDTLQYMQDNGASIVLHGYKHQYRRSETGEGFEFWDVENDRPIYQPSSEDAKTKSDFKTDQAYQSYMKEAATFEKQYIEEVVTKGIQELTDHNLYPLAFEAPHYAMSQQGYDVVSDHFSSYVGQLQLTNNTWKGQYAPPYESQPSFLHGMTVYPETLGYIEKGEQASFDRMDEEIGQRSTLTKSYLSAFYHPYLGLEGLKKVVQNLEAVDDSTWLDLKEQNNTVSAGDLNITSDNGQIKVDNTKVASEHERSIFRKEILKYAAFPLGILIIVILYVARKALNRKKEN
ncbi:hypothetical protein AAV35_000915 [Salimicrobium jeotgali]|uniref:DUF2334 domain-containing protein n=2 Tax=Salimicrobium TaxID=351195 RepID=K2FLU9_9BACI|nr:MULTISPECIES: DUF2334 domain-containing protein [Salimicrobium]AKG03482.1 hypothetical protein AAV35_000915 [Salimicrobium jeotgali]EKE31966.1 hypothetical protein MJ3_05083 [Salimicrobium jeotgali]MBM7695930.1 uncharacterized protein YdaL [Salimicrobium jeotgali]SIS89266.1 Uncharacterized protein YdaL [Salimicrobium salexigens]